jgi:hypothetical protein
MPVHPVYRISVYVPPSSLDAVLAAARRHSSLQYGQYDHVAHWTSVGVEHFHPLPTAKPEIGSIGQTSRIDTIRLEFAIERDPDLLDRLVGDVLETHPWEEPVVFVDEAYATATHFDQP